MRTVRYVIDDVCIILKVSKVELNFCVTCSVVNLGLILNCNAKTEHIGAIAGHVAFCWFLQSAI